MATNCTSEDLRDCRPTDAEQREVLGWVARALRSERLLADLRRPTAAPRSDR